MSSITYHYGSKEGLYLAAADHIGREMDDFAAPMAPMQTSSPAMPCPRGRRSRRSSTAWSTSSPIRVARAGRCSSCASRCSRPRFERIYRGPMGKMFETLVELVCVATGRDDRRAARIAVLTLFRPGAVCCARRGRRARGWWAASATTRRFSMSSGRRSPGNIDAILQSMAIVPAGDERGHA